MNAFASTGGRRATREQIVHIVAGTAFLTELSSQARKLSPTRESRNRLFPSPNHDNLARIGANRQGLMSYRALPY